ncbi:hypothetical protein SEA_ALEEMILY_151 [Gordonia phage Aleemily]|uniref:DUF2786 domain-containing protein n=2 Tax=Cafassovirus TaxID=3425056 RepID=A0A9E7TYE1_9CAUD|nr:hypothetical protein SEA_CAFASSO_153 [Gordonia phage Cafasso]UVK59891.1 hypothetical protein SEA_ALEEMILY_151 [Gordonia phage Aleemily]
MNENDSDKILNRIRGLFAKAKAVAGTPEADVFNEKALELIAKYGIDEQAARMNGIDGSIDDDKVIKVTYTFGGDYGMQRLKLVWAVVSNLHCKAIHTMAADGRDAIVVVGVKRHIMRAKLLYGFLEPQMLAGAVTAATRPEVLAEFPDGVPALNRQVREGYMEGWAEAMAYKIRDVELAALRQVDRNAGDTTMALQRSTDEARATKAFDKLFPPALRGRAKATKTGGAAYRAGMRDGSTTDVGQTRMGAGAGTRVLA